MSDNTPPTDDIVHQIVNNSHTLTDAVNNVAAWMTQMVQLHGQQAVNLVLRIAQIDAIGQLIGGGILLLVAVLCVIFGVKSWKKATRVHSDYDFPGYYVLSIILFVVTIISFVASMIHLTDMWAWVTAFNPSVGIAGHIYSHYIHVEH